MELKELDASLFGALAAFEEEARETERGVLFGEIDRVAYVNNLEQNFQNPAYRPAHTLLAVEGDKVIGRVDTSLLATYFGGGELRGYIDWIYVLKQYRHGGLAQKLIKAAWEKLKELGAAEVFLIVAENQEAQRFYHHLEGCRIQREEVLYLALGEGQ